MGTTFRIHLYDTHYDVYKDNKLFVSTDVPTSFYHKTILCAISKLPWNLLNLK